MTKRNAPTTGQMRVGDAEDAERRDKRPTIPQFAAGRTTDAPTSSCPPHGIPHRIPSRSAPILSPLDPRTAFLLSFIDGRTSVEMLIELSGIGEGEVTALLDRLVRLGVIVIEQDAA